MVDEALRQLVADAVSAAIAPLVREVRELRAERQHDGGRWGSRQEAATHHGGASLDWVDARIADKTIRARKLGPEPKEVRFDKLGRKVDRRRVEVWLEGPPKSDIEIAQSAAEARAR